MPKITSIEPQKRRKGRFNIYIDGQFSFALDESLLAKNMLIAGKSLTGDQIEKLIKENEAGKLFDASLRFLSYRPRSEKEVKDFLAKKTARVENIKFTEASQSPVISQIITRLKQQSFLDDEEFAEWWVKARTSSQPKGPYLIKRELTGKGIDKEIIEKAISKIKNQTELGRNVIEKKIKTWEKLTNLELKNKIYQHLARRGFDSAAIKEVIAQIVKKV